MSSFFEDEETLFDFVITQGQGVKGVSDLNLTEVPQKFVKPLHLRIPHHTELKYEDKPIDLSLLHHDPKVADQIVNAAETLGFFQVINHGVPSEVLEKLMIATHRFFEQKAERKAVFSRGNNLSPLAKYMTSYNPAKEATWDWRDSLSLTHTSDEEAMEHWPAECSEEALEYLKKSFKMIRKLLEVLLGRLGVEVNDAIFEAYTYLKMVNLNYYPSCPNPELTIGACPHSDMGLLAILFQDGIGGLSVKAEKDIGELKKGEWIDIPPIDGAFVINVGDVLQVLSNGRYVSSEHRVRTSEFSRVSLPIFINPNPSEKIGPLPQTLTEGKGTALYKEFIPEEHMNSFVNNVHVGKESLKLVSNKTPS